MNKKSIFQKLLGLWLLVFILLGVGGCSLGAAGSPMGQGTVQEATQIQGDLEIYTLDIGQGDAHLIKVKNRYTLIDTGDVEHREQIVKLLKDLGVTELDNVILTHPHSDHIGGFYAIINNFKIGKVYDNGSEPDTSTYRTYIRMLKTHKVSRKLMRDGDTLDLGNGVVFYVYAPWKKPILEQNGKMDENNNSIVGKLTYGDFSMLFTGDAEKDEEAKLLKEHKGEVKAQVLKLGHHGSRTSSSDAFLDTVQPQVAVASMGVHNDYGHPHEQTLKRLEKRHIKFYRTDQMGTIHIVTDGKQYTLGTTR